MTELIQKYSEEMLRFDYLFKDKIQFISDNIQVDVKFNIEVEVNDCYKLIDLVYYFELINIEEV